MKRCFRMLTVLAEGQVDSRELNIVPGPAKNGLQVKDFTSRDEAVLFADTELPRCFSKEYF